MTTCTSQQRRYFNDSIGQAVAWTVIACAGGIAKYITNMQKNNVPFNIIQLFLKIFVSAFSGLTAGHTVMIFTENVNVTVVAAALGGWLGADMLDFLWEAFRKQCDRL